MYIYIYMYIYMYIYIYVCVFGVNSSRLLHFPTTPAVVKIAARKLEG